MENNQEQETEIVNTAPKKGSLKLKIYLVLILILIGAGAYGYFWYEKTNTLRIEAVNAIGRAEQLDALDSAIQAERDRCETFITQKEGDFGSFQYCQKFLDWVDGLRLPVLN